MGVVSQYFLNVLCSEVDVTLLILELLEKWGRSKLVDPRRVAANQFTNQGFGENFVVLILENTK